MSNDFNTFMSIFFPQPLNSQALDPLEIMRVTKWEGLSFSLGRKEMDPLCTNQLTQEKCQRVTKFCCAGGKTNITIRIKIIINIFCIRYRDEWLVRGLGIVASLKTRGEVDPFLPPRTGWLFYKGRRVFEEGPSLTCSLPSNSPPCCLTVTLSGAAKEAHGDCEGEYKSTGLISTGRPVKII